MLITNYFSKNKFDFSINSRNNAKEFILKQKISANDFIEILSKKEGKEQVVLLVILDSLVDDYPTFLNNVMDAFLTTAITITNETGKRCISRIFYHLLKKESILFTPKQKQQLIRLHFDWLIKQSLVATRVNCISVLFYLRNEEQWITDDLLGLIDQELYKNEPSFRSRAIKVKNKIEKNQSRL